MNFNKFILLFVFFLITGCEEQNTNNIESNNNTVITSDYTVITSDYQEEPFFFNFETGQEDSSNWHISLQKTMIAWGANQTLYPMPNIITNNSTLIAIEGPNTYDEISFSTINTVWSADTTLLSYAGDYVVLDYQFTCENPTHSHPNIHKILVWNYTYLFKIINSETTYKVRFEEYESGVVLFKYSELK